VAGAGDILSGAQVLAGPDPSPHRAKPVSAVRSPNQLLAADRRAHKVRALSRILVIGGYGGFGARLTRRLVDRGHKIVVVGRSLDKARAFCANLTGAEPIAADRNGDLGGLFERAAPDLVIDAAGPFQGSDYRVALACARAGIPYVDLADARGFVAGIDALDAEATAAGVAIITGASSVPALSGAVVRRGLPTAWTRFSRWA
jgi:saccharopine dehydrogenase-like NADP-dependent oxidoreductase